MQIRVITKIKIADFLLQYLQTNSTNKVTIVISGRYKRFSAIGSSVTGMKLEVGARIIKNHEQINPKAGTLKRHHVQKLSIPVKINPYGTASLKESINMAPRSKINDLGQMQSPMYSTTALLSVNIYFVIPTPRP